VGELQAMKHDITNQIFQIGLADVMLDITCTSIL
jgi:hypothetical protein